MFENDKDNGLLLFSYLPHLLRLLKNNPNHFFFFFLPIKIDNRSYNVLIQLDFWSNAIYPLRFVACEGISTGCPLELAVYWHVFSAPGAEEHQMCIPSNNAHISEIFPYSYGRWCWLGIKSICAYHESCFCELTLCMLVVVQSIF